jgi:hypothetical protein
MYLTEDKAAGLQKAVSFSECFPTLNDPRAFINKASAMPVNS